MDINDFSKSSGNKQLTPRIGKNYCDYCRKMGEREMDRDVFFDGWISL